MTKRTRVEPWIQEFQWTEQEFTRLGAGQDVGIGVAAGDQLAEDDPKAEDVRLVIVVLTPETLRGHPVGGAHLNTNE